MPTVTGRDGRHTQGGVLGTRGMLQPRHVHFYYTLQSRLPHIFYRLCLQAEACQSTERLLHKGSYRFSVIYNQGFSFSVKNSKTPLLLQTPRTHRIICLSLDYQQNLQNQLWIATLFLPKIKQFFKIAGMNMFIIKM